MFKKLCLGVCLFWLSLSVLAGEVIKFKHLSIEFEVSYPATWKSTITPGSESGKGFMGASYLPMNEEETGLVHEAGGPEEADGSISIFLSKYSGKTSSELALEQAEALLKMGLYKTDSIHLVGDVKKIPGKEVFVQEVDFIGMQMVIASIKVGEYLATFQIIGALEMNKILNSIKFAS